jgi:hypothetical protein
MIQVSVSIPAVGVFAGMYFFEDISVVEIVNAGSRFG